MACGDHIGFVGLCGREKVRGADSESCSDRKDGCISSDTREGRRAEGGALAFNIGLDVTLIRFDGVCRGERPHVSNAARECFLLDEPDSIELKLDVLPCLGLCDNSPLMDLWRGEMSGGRIATVLGLSFGLKTCEAPFRYDRCKLKTSFVGEGARKTGAACRKGTEEGPWTGGVDDNG